MKKALVTGGAGFIGSNVVDGLIDKGYEVVVIDNLYSGKLENVNSKAKFIKEDICNDLNDLFEKEKFDCVFHLAAIPRVQFSINFPEKTHNENINGTFNLLNLCREHKVKRFVSTSSSSVYGDQKIMPLVESMETKPISPYALHKLVGEHYCKLFYFLYGLETISLRYFNVYGLRQDPNGDYACLIPKFVELARKGEVLNIHGDGEQTRDFTHVKDVVAANILAAETDNKECFGEAFNIGMGDNKSVNEVTSAILKALNKTDVAKVVHGPSVIEPKDTLADISKVKRLLGWEPKVSFEDGLKNLVSG